MIDRAALWPGALAALLGIIVLAELLAPPDVAAPLPPPRQDAAAVAPQASAAGMPAAWSDVILARPIFRPDRRPLAAAPAAAEAMPRLTAIVITAAGASAVFVRDDGTAETVRPGGLVDGQAVKSISASAVTLAGPAGVTLLRPQFGAAPGADADTPPDTAAGAAPNLPFPAFPNNLDRN